MLDSASWPGSDWRAPGMRRRIAVPIRRTALMTGVLDYTLVLSYEWQGGVMQHDSVSGRLAVVNRQGSHFGAGWWLAGLEELQPIHADTLLWIGGDGSTRLYGRAAPGSGVFRAPHFDRPDSVTSDAGGYVRWAPLRTQVRFDVSGRHVSTTNRLGHVTQFGYAGPTSRMLTTLTVPTNGGTLGYSFHYGTTHLAAGVLESVHAPAPRSGGAPRVVRLTPSAVTSASARIDAIADPDERTVRFGYETISEPLRVTSRTDRRNNKTRYAFDAGERVGGFTIDSAGAPFIGSTFIAAASRGVAGMPAHPAHEIYSVIDGPRTDVTDRTTFWLNALGAPTRIRDALLGVTTITYDGQWPALAATTTNPVGLVTRATYNGRGLVDSVVVENPFGDGKSLKTAYVWHPTWELPLQVTAPSGVVTSYDYEPTGDRRWEQTGGSARRVTYGYDAQHFLRAIRTTITPDDSLFYDALGNVHRTRSPLGLVTQMRSDDIGRVEETTDPSGAKVRTYYDLVDQDTLTVQWGPARVAPSGGGARPAYAEVREDSVLVVQRFDEEGNKLLVSRQLAGADGPFVLESRWEYNPANRTVGHRSASATDWERYGLDRAGNVITHRHANGMVVTTTYDALNRPRTRVLPQVSIPRESCWTYWDWGVNCLFSFPTRDTSLACISADTARFTYDRAGNLRTANNGVARVARAYARGGQLTAEELRVRRYYGGGGLCDPLPPATESDDGPEAAWDAHIYTITARYDTAGRRDSLTYPHGGVRYTYDPVTGELRTVRDGAGKLFTFDYDDAGRLYRTTSPGGVQRITSFDGDGRIVGRSGWYSQDSLILDALGRVDSATVGFRGRSAASLAAKVWYDGLGAVTGSRDLTNSGSLEEFGVDALGNRTWTRTTNVDGRQPHPLDDGQRRYAYDPATGQVTRIQTADYINGFTYDQRFTYDGAGNTIQTHLTETVLDAEGGSGLDHDITRSTYGADQKLRVLDRHKGPGEIGELGSVYEEYWYDALGRRVFVRSRQTSGAQYEFNSYVERTVWDGDQIVFETRAPGGDTVSAATMERDCRSSGPLEGERYGCAAYTHAHGIDQPLSVVRQGGGPAWFAPLANWRGGYELASLGCSVTDPNCLPIELPGVGETTDGDRASQPTVTTWYGNLVVRKTDGSGLQYMRNRYYDPKTGRFTQSDPIGLAGGLNLYGFAGGDPVSYSDPFGLCVAVADCAVTIPLGIAAGKALIGVGMAVAAAGAVHTATKWEDVKAKARRAWATTKLVIGLATQFIPDAGDVKKAGPEDDDPDKRRKPPIESDKGAIPLEGADTEDKRVRRHEQDRERAAAPRQ